MEMWPLVTISDRPGRPVEQTVQNEALCDHSERYEERVAWMISSREHLFCMTGAVLADVIGVARIVRKGLLWEGIAAMERW